MYKNTTELSRLLVDFDHNQAADRRNKACEKEHHETKQRAVGWPPLVWAMLYVTNNLLYAALEC